MTSTRAEDIAVATSQARIDANRRNAARSTGPKSPETKAISARNSLKHGLTGEGIVLPDEDVEAVNGRFEALQAELAPKTVDGPVAGPTDRVPDGSAGARGSAGGQKARHGDAAGFGEVRRSADVRGRKDDGLDRRRAGHPRPTPAGHDGGGRSADRGVGGPGCEPGGPGLGPAGPTGEWQRIENLEGRRPEDQPISRDGALCKAFWGEPEYLQPGEVEGLNAGEIREWATGRLRERIAGRLAELRTLRVTFDPESLAKDCAEAAQRAIFDASKEATLARKYEAAAERGLYRAFERAAGGRGGGSRIERGADASDDEVEDCEALGSFSGGAKRGDAAGGSGGRWGASGGGATAQAGQERGEVGAAAVVLSLGTLIRRPA